MEITKEFRSFGGRQLVLRHASGATKTQMELSLYLPPASEAQPVPVLVYLSGLTCTWENATTKAGFQVLASLLGMAVVCPDSSPRGADVANDDAYDLGQGASFYLDATQPPWSTHFAMESYVADELPKLLAKEFPVDIARMGITGHSMGGHGALTLGLRYPERFRCISALSPIVAPSQVPWGQKAFSAYLGDDHATWSEHDACELVQTRPHPAEIRIDQGGADEFLARELQPERFERAAKQAGQALQLAVHPGYDHSYYFVASFMPEHLRHHARVLMQ
jgi:S-formylglutathione hydrolase